MIANNHKYNKPNNQSKHLFKNLLSINFDSKTHGPFSLIVKRNLIVKCHYVLQQSWLPDVLSLCKYFLKPYNLR